ncbi:unnamed protein product [Eretmochelys imbricata]
MCLCLGKLQRMKFPLGIELCWAPSCIVIERNVNNWRSVAEGAGDRAVDGPAGSDSGSEQASFSGTSEVGGFRQLLPVIRCWSLAAVGGSDQRHPQTGLPSSALPWLPGRMVGVPWTQGKTDITSLCQEWDALHA